MDKLTSTDFMMYGVIAVFFFIAWFFISRWVFNISGITKLLQAILEMQSAIAEKSGVSKDRIESIQKGAEERPLGG